MKNLFLSLLLLATANSTNAQDIIYAAVNKSDVQRMNFEIIGKVANNYLVYKESKGKNRISVYDEGMRLLEDVPVTVLPGKDELLDVSFFSYNSHACLLYQYQQGNVVNYMAARVEANGRILETPRLLDTTMIAYKADGKIYNTLASDDRGKILIYKINRKDRNLYRFTTKLYDREINLLEESRFELPMENGGEKLGGYSLANDGSFVFTKYSRLASGNIAAATLMEKAPQATDLKSYPIGTAIGTGTLFLDDIKVKVDDNNQRYLLTSFYSQQKKGNIDGLYVSAINKANGNRVFEKTTFFDETLRKKSKSGRAFKSAFDNYFINSIVVNNDGSFTVGAEELYTSNAGGWDRWGYWGSPFYSPWYGGWGGWGGYWSPYSYYSPYFYRSYWWGGFGPWGSSWYDRGWSRFHADNIAIISFDNEGNRRWDNVIVKNQTETETDGSISYQILRHAGNMHIYLNNAGKISTLEDVMIRNDGAMTENGLVAAKDKNIDFMPRYGKQTGPAEMIVPYSYKNNISFARVQL